MCSTTWSSCTGAYRVRGAKGQDYNNPGSGYWWNIQLLAALTLMAVHFTTEQVLSPLTGVGQNLNSYVFSEAQGSTLSTGDRPAVWRTTGQIRMLLVLAGDVEINPGPDNQAIEESLITGLAELVAQAPTSMRDVLCVWSPQKPTNVIVSELSNRKFTLPVLQPVLAWLWNKEVNDPLVKSLRKADIAQEIILGIERLLPDTCNECNQEFTVGRLEVPGLK